MLIRCRRLIKLVVLTTILIQKLNFIYCSYTNPLSQNPINSNGDIKVRIELNINDKSSCNEYTYTKDDTKKTETYEAKDNHGFIRLTIPSSCCWLSCFCCLFRHCNSNCCSEKLVWETIDPKQYAIKVVYEEKSNTVIVHMGDGKIKRFTEGGSLGCKSWNEVTSIKTPNLVSRK